MTIQTELNFRTEAPINTEKLSGQNKLVYDILRSGKAINRIEALGLGITALNSRISDLRNKAGIAIYDRFIKTKGGSSIKEYSLKKFEG